MTGSLPNFDGFYLLHIVRLGSNYFSGSIPPQVEESPWITDLDISFNL